MSVFLGIDTSNYTTSVAAYDTKNNKMLSHKKLLPVEKNACGLRQSDAVFSHVKQFDEIVKEVMSEVDDEITAIGVSTSPRDAEGSYMPCFMVGKMVANSISSALKIPCYSFSHQCGHVAAALFSVNRLDLLKSEFICFHVSGGTTDVLHIKPNDEKIISASLIGTSLDLKAGQAIDRVGVMLDLNFPCGAELEKLAQKSSSEFKIKPYIKDLNCSISGLENKVKKMLDEKYAYEDIAKFTISFINEIISKTTSELKNIYPNLPIIYAGGVMSNKFIKDNIQNKYGGFFAEPCFSSDNAAGIAVLCSNAYNK